MFIPWRELERRFKRALDRLDGQYPARITDLRASALFFFLHHLQRQHFDNGERLPVLVVTETTNRAIRMQQFLSAVERLVGNREPDPREYLVFPDFEPMNLFEYTDPAVDIIDARNNVLDGLLNHNVKAVITSFKAICRKLPPPEEYGQRKLVLATKPRIDNIAPDEICNSIPREDLAQRLDQLGYRQVTTVTSVGEYAIRGGLVDVFTVGEDLPVRVDLFGDEIEEIQYFKPETQRTEQGIDHIRILPMSTHAAVLSQQEVLAGLERRWERYAAANRDVLPASSLERLGEVVERDLELLASGTDSPRSGWYYRAVCSTDQCLLHYLPQGTPVVIHEEGFVDSETKSYFQFWRNRFGDWLRNGMSFLGIDDLYLRPSGGMPETSAGLAAGRFEIEREEGNQTVEVPAVRPLFTHSFGGSADELPVQSLGLDTPATGKWSTTKIVDTVKAFPRVKPKELDLGLGPVARCDRPVSVLSQFSSRLREVLNDEDLYPEIENAILPGGFTIPAASAGLNDLKSPFPNEWSVITDVEVFGEIAEVSTTPARRYRREAIKKTDELSPGDYVVHIDYGIGRFAQLTERKVAGVIKSFVEVEYAGRDRLFVPVEQLDRLRRYSYDGTEPKLNHLGRDTWRKTKEKVRQDTLELARRLLSLYKTRQITGGHSYSSRTVWEDEFADGFPYALTDDQVIAWRDVQADMESPKSMDRLLCGDVGFGKTEIALRAAFKACVDEKQVLVLCPTTVLADQHYRTFSRRCKPFPFKVEQLSRFQSKKEQKDIVARLQEGRVDIVIATHRALSKDVDFKRLGLMVVDEEQRFGVRQKEKLKMRWPQVDVLSMSATPIPRTLHMSLIGLRDISIIETPPVERKPIKTYVGEYDELMVREAMLRELGRGGQVYFLHNRVQDIEAVKEDLERLIPGEKVVIAHGKMREDQLEEVMHAFSLGAYKIMLATTIIENGLDIPTVNTIIVTHAENLGLSQMHQLRGRVGRSAVQAFAYFFHQPNRVLTEDSQNRLHAIYNYAYLGAGYEIAQSDLRIRGAGNLLGEAQSGLARAVGFEYYCELLARSISDVKALDEADIEEWEDTPVLAERPAAQIDLPLPSFIPESYIDDPVLRLEVLRNLASQDSEERLGDFASGIEDRFGELPQEVENLIAVVRVRNLATELGIERIGYIRTRHVFEIKLFADSGDWWRRASLADSRFSSASQPQTMELNLEFTGNETGRELYDALEGLRVVKR